jgi:hypothetical protein
LDSHCRCVPTAGISHDKTRRKPHVLHWVKCIKKLELSGGNPKQVVQRWQNTQKFSDDDKLKGSKLYAVQNLTSRLPDNCLQIAFDHVDAVGSFEESGAPCAHGTCEPSTHNGHRHLSLCQPCAALVASLRGISHSAPPASFYQRPARLKGHPSRTHSDWQEQQVMVCQASQHPGVFADGFHQVGGKLAIDGWKSKPQIRS